MNKCRVEDEPSGIGHPTADSEEGTTFPSRIFAGMSVGRLLIIGACIAVFLSPFTYIGNYAGDSQVHLIYGENAAQGNFFEFNPGEKSPGVTSPGYMLLVAAAFRVFPDILVPASLKLANLLFWYGLLWVFFLTARRLLSSTGWAVLATLAAGLLPGSVYNATIGMENGIFAFIVFLWVYLAIRARWFLTSPGIAQPSRKELGLGALMGLACWIRPEGLIVAVIALSYRTIGSVQSKNRFALTMKRSAVFLLPFAAVTGCLAYFHWSQTGYLIPTSGLSRILMSNVASDSFSLGPIFVSTKFSVRLAAYFPLTFLWLLANWALLKRLGAHEESDGSVGFLVLLFWAAFILYSTILGSLHLSRYVIFAMPAMVLVGMMAAKWMWEGNPPKERLVSYAPRCVLAVFVLALGGVFLLETNLRTQLDAQTSLWKSMSAPGERESFSNELYQQLGQPQELPISIALQEVQARYWLDDRFVVRSLDGRVDPRLLSYAGNSGIDHVGYIRDRKVRFLLDTPNYNRDLDVWSLRSLDELPPEASISHQGLTFSRLSPSRSSQRTVPRGHSLMARWTAGTDGVSVLHNFFIQDLIRVDHLDQE